jgi:primosomal protein N' (replication factor Y)
MEFGVATRPAEPGPASEDAARVAVLLPLPLAGPYDYAVPAGLRLAPGDLVRVPLGRSEAIGVVWGAGSAELAPARLKEVQARLDAPALPASVRRFIDWVAAYTLAPSGAVLRMALRAPGIEATAKPRLGYVRAAAPAGDAPRLTPARRRVLDLLADGQPRPLAEIARAAAVTPSVVRGLIDAGTIAAVTLPEEAAAAPDWRRPGPTLSPDQSAAAAALRAALARGGYSATLLEGVTGSGKTEVYFEAIAAALEQGRQVLVLLPEIALTVQFLDRFASRFGARPVEWHSDLTPAERRRAWQAAASGAARVVVGARSALFLPFADLGLIVVDEEHEAAFKQEDGVLYHARDMAVARAWIGGLPIVLASATPSLESIANVERGRYEHVVLPARHGAAQLPRIAALDLRREPPPRGRWIAPTLERAVAETLAAGEQALLFLNRRGYAPLTLCRACGHRLRCPHCTAWLVDHRFRRQLLCHHCGYIAPELAACPDCAARDSFVPCGPGVERVAEEAALLFPEARLAVLSSDHHTSPQTARALIEQIASGAVDLVLGTQVIAKGHHFPNLTLVGVIDADLGLGGGDLRAAERTYQLLAQVAGRAGRAEKPGRAVLQTYMPEHPVMEALVSGDREAFLAAETEARAAQGLPPFGRLVALIVSGTDDEAVDAVARQLARTAPQGPDIAVLGPAPAPLAMLRGRRRVRLLLKAARGIDVQAVMRAWLARIKAPHSVRVAVDVDPYSFL